MFQSNLLRSKRFRYAIPFLIFIVGGSVGLREFTALRYRYRSVEPYTVKEEAKKIGMVVNKPEESTLEAQYEKMKKTDTEDWENKRVPRPAGWE